MRIAVVGGTGHIGTFLVPQLVALGHEVIVMSRGERDPYRASGAWSQVRTVRVDRDAEDAAGTFGSRVADLEADVVIDLICFTEDSARQIGEALTGRVRHFLHCGTIWVYGTSTAVPTTEQAPRRPLGEYGIAKAAIETYLQDETRLPSTVIHPGHISGPGWLPINPAGHLDPAVFQGLADGNEVTLPNLGMETLQHVHAADVAGIFLAAIANRSVAIGESFNAVAPGALTLRGYAEAVAGWFGQEAKLAFLPWDDWSKTVSEKDAAVTWDHIRHSPHCSLEKTTRLLGFRPRYSPLETVFDAVQASIADGRLVVR